MVSLDLTQKWWMGIVAGVFGVLGIGTALVALPAFADSGRSPNSATPDGVEVRLECKKGTWTAGSFNWTLAGKTVGTAVPLMACPNGRSRKINLPNVTKPPFTATPEGTGAATTAGTGAAAADGFLIKVSGKSNKANPGETTAACEFPSPNLSSKDMRQRNATFTCTADGGNRDSGAHMKIKVRWMGRGDDDQRGPFESRNEPRDPKPDDEKDKDKVNPTSSQDKGDNGNQGNSQGNGEPRGWLSAFSRGRGR